MSNSRMIINPLHPPALLIFVTVLCTAVVASARQSTQPTSGAPESIAGVVVDADGKPVGGARVLCVGPGQQAYIDRGTPRADVQQVHLATTSDPDGSFSFPRTEGAYWLVALADTGCADFLVSEDEARPAADARHSLKLRPWGSIEGVLRRGDKPLPDETVQYYLVNGVLGYEGPMVQFGDYAKTDAAGRFAFERVPAGINVVGHSISRQIAPMHTSSSTSHLTAANVQPGQTAKVMIGGTGRPVVGKLVLEEAVDWPKVQASLVSVPVPAGGFADEDDLIDSRAGTRSYDVAIEKDGRFRAEDVPEGRYRLMLINMGADADGMRMIVTEPAQFEVGRIEGVRSDEPLNVGKVEARYR